jgi:hypothetical protein
MAISFPSVAQHRQHLLLSGAYDGAAQAWLENWQGLKHAIETRQHIEIEHFRARPFRRSRSGCTVENDNSGKEPL